MRAMTADQITMFLEEPRIARVASVRSDGRPHVVPVWYEWDGECLRFEAQATSVKIKNLKRDPRVSVLVDMTHGGMQYKGVILEGVARIRERPEKTTPIAERIFRRYLGKEGLDAPTPRRLIYENDPVIAELTPTRVITWDNTLAGPGGLV